MKNKHKLQFSGNNLKCIS